MAHALALAPTVGTSGLTTSQAVAGPDPDRSHVHVLAQSRSTGTAGHGQGPPAARHEALCGPPHASALAALDGITYTAPQLYTQLGATGRSRADHDNTFSNTQSSGGLCDSELNSEGGDEPFRPDDGESVQVVTARAAARRLRASERQAPQGAEAEAKALQRAEDDALAAFRAAKAQRVLHRKAWDRDRSNGLWLDEWLALLADNPPDEERDARYRAVRRVYHCAERLAEHAADAALDVLEEERDRLNAIERAAQAQRNFVAAEAAARDLHLDMLRRSRHHNLFNIEKSGEYGHYDTAADVAKIIEEVGERKRWRREVVSLDETRKKSKNDFFGWLKAKGNDNKANYFKYQQWIIDQYALFEKTFGHAHKNAFKIPCFPKMKVGPDDDVDEVFMVFA